MSQHDQRAEADDIMCMYFLFVGENRGSLKLGHMLTAYKTNNKQVAGPPVPWVSFTAETSRRSTSDGAGKGVGRQRGGCRCVICCASRNSNNPS
jgi:hypothetical protein